MTEREQMILRWALFGALAVAVVLASAVAWIEVHPLAGSGILLVVSGGLWATITGREHAARLSREKAAEQAKARIVSTAGFVTARPSPPPSEPGGG